MPALRGGNARWTIQTVRVGRLRIAAASLLAFGLVASCTGDRTPTSSEAVELPLGPCDYVCLDMHATPWGTLAVGTGWDEGAKLSEGYLATWLVRDGVTTRTQLTPYNVGDVGIPYIVPRDDQVLIIATGLGAGGVLRTWTTSDGVGWAGPTEFYLPGESPVAGEPLAWGRRLVFYGHQITDDDRFLASVWTSEDGITWQLAPRPSAWDDAAIVGAREAGDGLVVDVKTDDPAGPTVQWTTADFTNWRLLSTP